MNTIENSGRTTIDDEPLSPTTKIRGPDFDLGVPKEHIIEKLNWFDWLKYFWSTCVTLVSYIDK